MRLDCGLSLQQEVGWDRQTLRDARYLADTQDESFLVFSETVLLEQIKKWRREFPGIQPVHEVGYNSVGRLLEGLREQGVRLDVSSKPQVSALYDLALLQQDSGVVYNAPYKMLSHVRFARERGIQTFVFNSREEILKIKKIDQNARLVLLLDCSDIPNLVEIKALVEAGVEAGLEVVGLHLDLATGEDDLHLLEQWVRVSRCILDWSRGRGAPILRLHLGELTETSFSDQFSSRLGHLVSSVLPPSMGVSLSATVSRFLVTPTVTLAARILEARDEGEEKHYFINEGVFGAFTANLCVDAGVQTPFALGGGKGRRGFRSELHGTRIHGPSGDELDVILDEVFLPQLEEDDWLLFPGMGCVNNAEFCRHANVSGTANYVYRKEDGAGREVEPSKPCSWEFSSCESFEINLDHYEIVSLSSVLWGDLVMFDE